MAAKSVTKAQPVTKVSKAQKNAALRRQQAQQAAILLKHGSDPTRLHIILMLSESERHVGALSETLNQTQPAVSHHLAMMRHGSIIARRREGKRNYYALTEAGEQLAAIAKQFLA